MDIISVLPLGGMMPGMHMNEVPRGVSSISTSPFWQEMLS